MFFHIKMWVIGIPLAEGPGPGEGLSEQNEISNNVIYTVLMPY